jgi:hypothetical protein
VRAQRARAYDEPRALAPSVLAAPGCGVPLGPWTLHEFEANFLH